MSTKTNGILTKANINAMGPFGAWSGDNLTECVTFDDLYNTPVSNARMNDASISTNRVKLVRNDKIVKHFVRQTGKVTINFTNNTDKGLNTGAFDIIITFPKTFRVPKTTDWADTDGDSYVSFIFSTPLEVSDNIRNWDGSGGSSFGSIPSGTTLSINKTLEDWFVANPNYAAGTYSIVFDNVSNTKIRFVIGTTTMLDYTSGTNSGYKHFYQVTNSLLLGTYNAFKNQTLTINISVEEEG